jgi:hypothetical protein
MRDPSILAAETVERSVRIVVFVPGVADEDWSAPDIAARTLCVATATIVELFPGFAGEPPAWTLATTHECRRDLGTRVVSFFRIAEFPMMLGVSLRQRRGPAPMCRIILIDQRLELDAELDQFDVDGASEPAPSQARFQHSKHRLCQSPRATRFSSTV